MASTVRSLVFPERQPVPDELKKSLPWLGHMKEYVNKWLPFGFPDHIDANEVYVHLSRSSGNNTILQSRHSTYGRVKAALVDLNKWMSSRPCWESPLPFVPTAASIMAICCIDWHEQGLPSTIKNLIDNTELGFMLHPLDEMVDDMDAFWHGAMLEDKEWREDNMFPGPGKSVMVRDKPEGDLNPYFKGVKPTRNSTHQVVKDRHTPTNSLSKKRRRSDTAGERSDVDDVDRNTVAISDKLQAALMDSIAATADVFTDAIKRAARGSMISSGLSKAQQSDSIDGLRDEMNLLVDSMKDIMKERLDEIEGSRDARLDGIESAFGRVSKRVRILEDKRSERATTPQQFPMTPQSGPRVRRGEFHEPRFESMTPSPTSTTKSYFDAEFSIPSPPQFDTPSPPRFRKKVTVGDRATIVRVINDILIKMWEEDDITIIRQCKKEFPHPKWASIIFTVRSLFLRGGFLDCDGKALGDGDLLISEADWDVLSGLKDL